MKNCRTGKETKALAIERLEEGERTGREDEVAAEVPFTIVLNGTEIATLLCTPTGLDLLAAGFLFSEGYIEAGTELQEVTVNEKGWYAHVTASGAVNLPEGDLTGRLVASGCGSAGARGRSGNPLVPVRTLTRMASGVIHRLMKEFLRESDLFRGTGGVHSCALCTHEGIDFRADDIGRHNALDKVIGWSFLNGVDVHGGTLLSTGRLSSDMVVKSTRAGIAIIASRSAPTSLAVELAGELGITLIGFVRGKRMNIYTNGDRIGT